MTKLNVPLFAFKAVGHLAKTVTCRVAGKSTIMEKKPQPTDLRSASQITQRTLFREAIVDWHLLTAAEKATWEHYGTEHHMTGYAWYMRWWLLNPPAVQTHIQDADEDTIWDTEKNADEDMVRGQVAGVEAFLLNPSGILDLPKQSAAKCKASVDQVIPNSGVYIPRLLLDSEDYDTQNEFDSSVVAATADATVANKLHDTGNFTESAAYYVGRQLWNTTDDTYALVTGKDSNDQLSIDVNIMANGEAYKLYFSRFTATHPGLYIVAAQYEIQGMGDGQTVQLILKLDGTTVAKATSAEGAASWPHRALCLPLLLAANDYLSMYAWQNSGANKSTYHDDNFIFLSVVKVA